MLNKYIIYITSNTDSMDRLENGIKFMDETHSIAKMAHKSFRGMRKNWMPLVLFDRILQWRKCGIYNDPLEKLYIHCINTEVIHSLYLDAYKRQGDKMEIHYRSKRKLDSLIVQILSDYKVESIKIDSVSY